MRFITVMHVALFGLASAADVPTLLPSGMKDWTGSSALVFHNTVSPESLIDIPLLVILTPDRIDYDRCKAGGSDLRFLDRHGTGPLDHEIVSWTPGSASHIWVRVPQIEAASERDFIWMVWGNPDAPDVQNAPGVWRNGYVGVWHLAEGYEDATGRTSVSDDVEKLNAYCNQKWKGLEALNAKVIPRVYLEWPKEGKRDPKGWYGPSDMERFDYSSQQFQQRLRQMIAKMGEAWNNDPRVAYIEMGLIGFWGEQHDPFISSANELLLREMFEEHLGHKKVLIRHPWDFPGSAFGVYWDSFAHFDREMETQVRFGVTYDNEG